MRTKGAVEALATANPATRRPSSTEAPDWQGTDTRSASLSERKVLGVQLLYPSLDAGEG